MRPWLLGMVALLGCSSEEIDALTPQEGWSTESVPLPDVLLDGLDAPRGVAVVGDALYVAEYGAGRLLRLEGDQVEVIAEGLLGPWMVAADAGRLVFTERDGGRVVEVMSDGALTALAEGLVLPGRVELDGDVVAWVDEGEDGGGSVGWNSGGTAGASVGTVGHPRGLAITDQAVLVAARDSERVLSVDLAGGLVSTVANLDGAPQDLVVQDGRIFSTAYANAWPRTAFVFWVQSGLSGELLGTPPSPALLRLSGDTLVWSSRTGISAGSTEGGSSWMVAIESAVGDLEVQGERVVWTDWQRGEVLSAPLGS